MGLSFLFCNIYKEKNKSLTMLFLFVLMKECMVDEDGRFTELAGPELQSLSVMTEGTDKGAVDDVTVTQR